jgi:sigma-B regulation protein RsbU (phosphoserine phosphatase)
LVDAINHVFWQSTSTEHYATLFYGVYERGSLRYVNAGHSAPVVLRADGSVEVLDSTGMPVGMFATWRGEASTLRLLPGDKLVLVSDGVLEAGVQADSEFGHRGIVSCCGKQSAADTVDRILAQASRCGAEDDMTAVVLNVV